MLKIVFLCGVKGRLLLLPTELAVPWQQLCWWFLTQRIHLFNFLLVFFLLLLQCNPEDKIGFYEHWNGRNGVKLESPIFTPSPQFKPGSITFTDVKCQALNRGAGGTAELLRCFTQTWPTLTTSWKPDVIFPHPNNLNFSPLHKKSKYKGVFPLAGLSLVQKTVIST